MTALTLVEIDGHRASIGRSTTIVQSIDLASGARFEAAVGTAVPSPLRHWAYFHDIAPDDRLGVDGHPRRGGFLPAIEQLPRRMFAASAIGFHAPLAIAAEAALTLRIADVRHKHGRSGDLMFVDVERIITQAGVTCITEMQTLVYKPAASAPPAAATPVMPPAEGTVWRPSAVNLFRFSAATFNSHRIHYDRAYAVGVECYADLVVQGPFIAARLATRAAQRGTLAEFAFRAEAPCFVDRPIGLVETAVGAFAAIRDDGVVAMTAKAAYQ